MTYIPVAFLIWLVIPTFLITLACVTTDILNGVCVPWGVYSSFDAQRAILFIVPFVEYLLPLALMIFCYSRIVYKLRTKVTAHHRRHSLIYGYEFGNKKLLKKAAGVLAYRLIEERLSGAAVNSI